MFKSFKVVSVSANRNAFGLQGIYLMAQDGDTYQVGASHLNVKKQGAVLRVPLDGEGEPVWAKFGFEIPEKVAATAPPGVVKEVWSDSKAA